LSKLPIDHRRLIDSFRRYHSFRSTQGRDVPICYGFFNFTMPWNKTVKGVILEDLTKIALPLPIFGRNFTHTGDGFEERDSDDESGTESIPGHSETIESTIDKDLARRRAKKLKIFVSPTLYVAPVISSFVSADLTALRVSATSSLALAWSQLTPRVKHFRSEFVHP